MGANVRERGRENWCEQAYKPSCAKGRTRVAVCAARAPVCAHSSARAHILVCVSLCGGGTQLASHLQPRGDLCASVMFISSPYTHVCKISCCVAWYVTSAMRNSRMRGSIARQRWRNQHHRCLHSCPNMPKRPCRLAPFCAVTRDAPSTLDALWTADGCCGLRGGTAPGQAHYS